jgi:GNAT superfamily N-acetyltransferase
MINAVLDIKLLSPMKWHVLRTTRLRALRDSPRAFMSHYETEVGWGEAQWRERFTAATWAVAVESGTVIGIAGLVDGNGDDGRHVEWTWVDPDRRRRGVFRALLEALIDLQRGNGARDMALWVLENNHEARQVYAQLGFQPTGERQHLPDDRYELRLRLRITSRG